MPDVSGEIGKMICNCSLKYEEALEINKATQMWKNRCIFLSNLGVSFLFHQQKIERLICFTDKI